MKKVAIITDSNSGITQAQGRELGIFVLPMPFSINNQTYLEDVNLTQYDFYDCLRDGDDVYTSQPSPEAVMKLWDSVLQDFDEIVHIPMSSNLSGSFDTAHMLAEDYNGKVFVVDNHRISITLKQAVLDAIQLNSAGKSALEIKERLEKESSNASIYLMVNTLKYLTKGGRITPAAAALGTLLKIKPVLQIQGGKIDAFSKARTVKQAKSIMMDALKKDMKERFNDDGTQNNVNLYIAHSNNEDAALVLSQELSHLFPDYTISVETLSLSVACHVGPGTLAVACTKKLTI